MQAVMREGIDLAIVWINLTDNDLLGYGGCEFIWVAENLHDVAAPVSR